MKPGDRISAQVIMSLSNGIEEPVDVTFATDDVKLTNLSEDVMVLSVKNGAGVVISMTFTKEK